MDGKSPPSWNNTVPHSPVKSDTLEGIDQISYVDITMISSVITFYRDGRKTVAYRALCTKVIPIHCWFPRRHAQNCPRLWPNFRAQRPHCTIDTLGRIRLVADLRRARIIALLPSLQHRRFTDLLLVKPPERMRPPALYWTWQFIIGLVGQASVPPDIFGPREVTS